MIRRKAYLEMYNQFKKNKDMEGYNKWFEENVNCEVFELPPEENRRGVRLLSKAKNYTIIIIEGFPGITWRVDNGCYKMLD